MVALHHAPRGGHQQHEREIGGRIRQHVGRVRHQDAVPRGCRHIDVVVAHRHVGDHLDAIQGGQDLRRELVHKLAHHGLFAADAHGEFLGAHAIVRFGVVHVRVLLQKGDGLGKYAFGNQYGRFHGTQIVAHAAPGLQFSHG